MAIERSDSQQTTCSAAAMIDGERRQVATATCTIRPGRSVIFSIDLVTDAPPEAQDMGAISAMFSAYLEDEMRKAENLGIPIQVSAHG